MAINLAKIISNAVGVVDTVTKSLQCKVIHKAWTDSDNWGDNVYSSPVELDAIVEQKLESKIQQSTGAVVQTKAKITFLSIPNPNGATGRIEPIDPRDILVLPDGTTGPIFRPEGFINPETDRPFVLEVYLAVGSTT